jgi:hypothetical protein
MPTKLNISKIEQLNTIVIKQEINGTPFFIAANNNLVIGIDTLATILTFLVKSGYMSEKVLEGILAEVKE